MTDLKSLSVAEVHAMLPQDMERRNRIVDQVVARCNRTCPFPLCQLHADEIRERLAQQIDPAEWDAAFPAVTA